MTVFILHPLSTIRFPIRITRTDFNIHLNLGRIGYRFLSADGK